MNREKELFMKDFNGEKVFCLGNDKETLKDMVFYLQEKLEEKDKEIESLKEELKEYRKPIMQYYKKVTSIGDKNE